MHDALYDPDDQELDQHGSPKLEIFVPNYEKVPDTRSGPSPDPEPAPTNSRRKKRHRHYVDIEDIPLVNHLNPNVTGLTHFGPHLSDDSTEGSAESTPEMKESFEALAATAEASTEDGEASPSTLHNTPNVKSEQEKSSSLADGDVATLQAQASAGLEYEEKSRAENVEDPSLKHRVDSAQEQVPQLPQEKRPPRSGRASPPPKLVTDERSVQRPEPETITTSPILRKNMMMNPEGPASTLPPLQQQTPVSQDGNSTSPKTETLPPIRQVTGPLSEFADVAIQQPYSHHQSPSFGSTTSQSPMLPYHYPPSNQTSPSSQYPYSAMSPTSTIGDTQYGSPTQHSSRAYFHRRSSGAIDHVRQLPASLPSASSGESHGHASSTDGYSTSTAHTTPIDAPPAPDPTRQVPILPPPPGMPQSAIVVNSGFKCDWPGCTAPPFQTQYLLR